MRDGMKPRNWILHTAFGVLTGAVAGCVVTTHDVHPAGGDTFVAASNDTIGGSSAAAQKVKAFEDANAYCKRQGKEVETVSERGTDSGSGKFASAEIVFRCVAPGGQPGR
jgi:hypothetical protein